LPDQDLSGDNKTHLGAAQTQILCLIIHSLGMHHRIQNLCLGIIHFFLEKVDGANNIIHFVLKKMDGAKDREGEKNEAVCV
jgi:hypothetical protein